MDAFFADLAALGESLERTSARLEKAALLADFLRQLAPDEVAPATRLILGQPFPAWDTRTLNVSWKQANAVVQALTTPTDEQRERIWSEAVDGGEAVRMLFEVARVSLPAPDRSPLTILEVYQTFEAIAAVTGKGSRARKAELLHGLLERASPEEAKYVVKNLFGEMRHGVSEGIMLDAIARAADVPARVVRRAHQLWGDIAEVAAVALVEGAPALQEAAVRLFRPLQPMLAQTASDMADVFDKLEECVALEYKLDGARVQVHVRGDQVRVYSRQLADVTRSVPDLVAAVRAGLHAHEAILEGEAVATGVEGRPLPFQDLMRRFRRVHDVDRLARQIPLHLHAFDLLWHDGHSLLDQPYEARRAALADAIGPPLILAAQVVSQDVTAAEDFARAAYESGHEGVMAKRLSSAYTPGVRGRHWLKLKHVETLDLVVVAADWGYGRRHGWLSNYHLAALNEETGEYMVVGKTFKGPTDEEFQAITARLLALERGRHGGTVFVDPQMVVEVLFDEVQDSPKYPSGLALRLARIARVRDDKIPPQANTLQDVRAARDRQRARKGHLA